ncbi:Uma2 family endonuclease [Streptomyces bambusae]|uniref:Uma2 family endonuclease n=2 Tax=Streptomyces bambusae TaxID=1550616 RepID=A0ABS6Z4U9_9ACTN|nr:Uma2 family endonuclease [Streptomyces bambusae]
MLDTAPDAEQIREAAQSGTLPTVTVEDVIARRQPTPERVARFEEVARCEYELVRLELVRGQVCASTGGDGTHGTIVAWLIRQCLLQRPELGLYPGRGLETEADGLGRVRPDGVLAPKDHFAGHGEWSRPHGVLMAVEVTSRDHEAAELDRGAKRDGYAEAGIPVYLLIDRENRSAVVHAEPEDGRYRAVTEHLFGAEVMLPDPIGITLATEALKDYTE